MGAASREREAALREKINGKRWKDLPAPGELDEVDPEFERLLSWFVQNRKEVAEELGFSVIIVDCNEGLYVREKSSFDVFRQHLRGI